MTVGFGCFYHGHVRRGPALCLQKLRVAVTLEGVEVRERRAGSRSGFFVPRCLLYRKAFARRENSKQRRSSAGGAG